VLNSVGTAAHIPFVNTERDCEILRGFYSDSEIVRVTLFGSDKTVHQIPAGPKLWVDGGVDALDRWPVASEKYQNFLKGFAHCELIADPIFQKQPDAVKVREFANSVLNGCMALRPAWLSIPQLPITDDSGRNRINRALADATRCWAAASRFAGRLVLPMVFTHQSQVNLKAARTPKVTLAAKCAQLGGAHGVWIVDSSLMDQEGSKTLEQTRFPSLIKLHEEVVACLAPDMFIVGGPYWGLNLVLWARGLSRYPAIGLGNQYQYHLPGGHIQAAKSRVALAALRRWVVVSQNLQSWLGAALKTLPPKDAARLEFEALAARFSALLRGNNRDQVAMTYKEWFESLAVTPSPGRALALYQQLSSAYVLGKGLPDLPLDEGSARRPERVAKQLMLVCL
jgi:hypothetical protein